MTHNFQIGNKKNEEAARLNALSSYNILDTPPEPAFDDIAMLASQACDTPIALVSLLDADRQWFKARVGLDACETPLNQSVCVHALKQRNTLVIPDLLHDERTSHSPLVTADPYLRFYAGARLENPNGVALGTLCVVDKLPRPEGLSEAQANALKALAGQVVAQLELRRAIMERDRALKAYHQAQQQMRADAVRCAALIRAQQAVSMSLGGIKPNISSILRDCLAAVPRADGAALITREDKKLTYDAAIGSAASQASAPKWSAVPFADLCMRTGQPFFSSDIFCDQRADPATVKLSSHRSLIIAPILRNGTNVSCLELCARLPGIFTDDDILTARLFAGVLGGIRME
ncbi:GAF domain-containing protein [Methylobacterium frigidaeris]|nr:GAF domain-containing protein [Methylobacterium frigidaeris]